MEHMGVDLRCFHQQPMGIWPAIMELWDGLGEKSMETEAEVLPTHGYFASHHQR